MTACVLDASVAAKWFLPPAQETLTEEALRLLENYASGRMSLVVPDLFWPEIGNIFWKAIRLRRISRESAESALTALEEQRIVTVPTSPLLKDAFAIAATFDRTVYDSTYVALPSLGTFHSFRPMNVWRTLSALAVSRALARRFCNLHRERDFRQCAWIVRIEALSRRQARGEKLRGNDIGDRSVEFGQLVCKTYGTRGSPRTIS